MDRYQLRYFLTIVETGSFSRAAARVNVAQPTLSVGIAKLEAELGVKLFQRSSRRVHLTEAGTRLLPHARRIMHEFNVAQQAVAEAEGDALLRIGILSTIPAAIMEQIFAHARRDNAASRFEVLDGGEREIGNMLQEGRIDIALTVLRGKDAQDGDPLVEEGYRLAVSDRHPLAGEALVTAERLSEEAMILRRHCEALSETSRFFLDRGIRPLFSFTTTSDERALAMVRAGLGVTVVPEGYQGSGVSLPRLQGFDLTRKLGLRYPETNGSGVSDNAFVRACRAIL